jgi:hypothetical protein
MPEMYAQGDRALQFQEKITPAPAKVFYFVMDSWPDDSRIENSEAKNCFC